MTVSAYVFNLCVTGIDFSHLHHFFVFPFIIKVLLDNVLIFFVELWVALQVKLENRYT